MELLSRVAATAIAIDAEPSKSNGLSILEDNARSRERVSLLREPEIAFREFNNQSPEACRYSPIGLSDQKVHVARRKERVDCHQVRVSVGKSRAGATQNLRPTENSGSIFVQTASKLQKKARHAPDLDILRPDINVISLMARQRYGGEFYLLVTISVLAVLAPNCIASETAQAGDTLKVIWQRITLYPDASGVPGLPAVGDDGSIYFGSTDSILYSLNPNGSDKWKYDTKETIIGDVTIDDKGTIYVAASGGLAALSPDGKLKWKISSERDASSPAIGPAGQIYFLRDGKLCAVTNDGKIEWERETHGQPSFSPVVGKDGTVYVSGYKQGTRISRLHAFSSDGTPKWTFETQGAIRASPALDKDDTIYFGGFLGDLFAVGDDGRLKWAFETNGASVGATPAISKDHVIYFGAGKSLYAVTNDGKLKWKVQTAGLVVSSPAIDVEGKIWFASNDGTLYRVDEDGSVTQKMQLEGLITGNVLIAKNGVLYLRDMHSLRAFEGAPAPAVVVWPTKRHDQHGTGRLDRTQER